MGGICEVSVQVFEGREQSLDGEHVAKHSELSNGFVLGAISSIAVVGRALLDGLGWRLYRIKGGAIAYARYGE